MKAVLLVGLNKGKGKMLLKYRIIFYAIILCLFGLTLMTVSPVFAQQGSGGGFFLCGTMDFPGWSAELSKDQYEECIKAIKAGENDSRLRGEPLLMEHRVICPPSFPDLCQRVELKKEDPRSIFYGQNYLHIYKLIDRRYNIHSCLEYPFPCRKRIN